MTDSARRTHETTATSITVLEAVADLDGGRASDVADHLDMAVSTAHKHLQTLIETGLVVKQGARYELGLKLFHLGMQATQRDDRYVLARETTFDIADRTNEEANFSVEENGRAITLFDTLGTASLEGFQKGEYFYLHNSAAGKAMLAEFSRDRVDEIVDRWGLPAETDNTITDRDTLFAELDEVRKQGYAVNRQESWEGLKAIAVAVTTPADEVLGAIDISGPPYRLDDEAAIARTLQKGVAELEADLEATDAI